jgi:hypothetical protein
VAIPRQEWARVEHNPDPLHLCAACRSRLVHPIEWEEAGRGSWTVSLRCPNCWWTGSGTYPQQLVDALELELDEGVDALVDDLRRLARANMAEAVERFVTALRADAVLPEDF